MCLAEIYFKCLTTGLYIKTNGQIFSQMYFEIKRVIIAVLLGFHGVNIHEEVSTSTDIMRGNILELHLDIRAGNLKILFDQFG